MLFALLYDPQDEIIAAAPACDQLALGDEYWFDCQGVEIDIQHCQTAYVKIADLALQDQLLAISADDELDRTGLTYRTESSIFPAFTPVKAA